MSTAIPATNDLLPLVAPLADFDRNSIPLAGGKGANLGELIQAGFPVPEGFVITTRAFDQFVQSDGLQSGVLETLSSLPLDDPAWISSGGSEAGANRKRAHWPDRARSGFGGQIEAHPQPVGDRPGFLLRVKIPTQAKVYEEAL